VRVLRPLRTVQRITGMRVLVGSLAASLPALLDVAELFGFLILAFGITGVETFAGRLHYRCVDDSSGESSEILYRCIHLYLFSTYRSIYLYLSIYTELFGFLILAFGITGVETFAGRLHYRCVDDSSGETTDIPYRSVYPYLSTYRSIYLCILSSSDS